MRVVINERRLKRSRQNAQILFFVSLAILLGGLVLSSGFVPTQSGLLLMAPLIIMPIGLVTTLISIRLTNDYVRPPHAEDVLRDGLKGIDKRSILYSYILPANHVLVAPQGVYTLTTRFQETRFKVEGEKWTNYKARGPLGPLFLYLKQEYLGKPFVQADAEAVETQKIIDSALGEKSGVEVQAAVVFINDKATLEIVDPAMPVVYANSKKKPSLKALLREEKKDRPAVLNPAQIEVIHEKIAAEYGAKRPASAFVESEA
ncbi:MAG TPA: hypothetical protein VMT34_03970 [Aggregatilineales bacterium]|nr:hypothetical protein [Aggregatilineales bacterium]